jgi:hypothetical protein
MDPMIVSVIIAKNIFIDVNLTKVLRRLGSLVGYQNETDKDD